MSPEERAYMKTIDDEILTASSKKLKRIQELDKKTQLEGSFYDVFYRLENNSKHNVFHTSRTENSS